MKRIVLLVLIGLLSTVAANANSIINGDFEIDVSQPLAVFGWQQFQVHPSTMVTTEPSTDPLGSGMMIHVRAANDGGGIGQSIQTPNQGGTLFFDVLNAGPDGILNGGLVLVLNGRFSAFSGIFLPNGKWTHFEETVIDQVGSVAFESQVNGDAVNFYVDNVSFTPGGTVPEPATLWLLGIGIVLLSVKIVK